MRRSPRPDSARGTARTRPNTARREGGSNALPIPEFSSKGLIAEGNYLGELGRFKATLSRDSSIAAQLQLIQSLTDKTQSDAAIAELEKIVSSRLQASLSFKLVGLNLERDGRAVLDFLNSGRGVLARMTELDQFLEGAQNAEEINKAAEDLGLSRFMRSFESGNPSWANVPFAFYKYALQREVRLIKRQASQLEKPTNQDILSGESSGVKAQAFLEKELGRYQDALDGGADYPKAICAKQTASLLASGFLNIALTYPASRPFKSRLGVVLPADRILSADQLSALESIENAIIKGEPLKGGKAEIRIGTGGGKSFLTEIIREHYAGKTFNIEGRSKSLKQVKTIDLNSTPEEVSEVFDRRGSGQDLDGQIIQLDEAYFFGKFSRFAVNEAELRKQNPRATGEEFELIKLTEIERIRNSAIVGLRKRGANVMVFGASESAAKIKIEIRRLEEKIAAQEESIRKSALINRPENQEVVKNGLAALKVFKALRETKVTNSGVVELKQRGFADAKNLITPQFQFALQARKIYNLAVLNLGSGDKPELLAALEGKLFSYYEQRNEAKNEVRQKRSDKDLSTAEAKKEVYDLLVRLTEETDLLSGFNDDRGNEDASVELNRLKTKLDAKKSQYYGLIDRREIKTKERFDASGFFADSRRGDREIPNNLLELVRPYLPRLEVRNRENESGVTEVNGDKLQHVLPDFIINKTTCSDANLAEISRLTGADIVIVPHKDVDGKLRSRIYRDGQVTIADVGEAINSTLGQVSGKKIVSFFANIDEEGHGNSTGGDYGVASVGITHRNFQAKRSKSLTLNVKMQADGRDRTSPVVVEKYPPAQQVIIHEDISKEGLWPIMVRNTELDDEVHAIGYLRAKQREAEVLRKQKALEMYQRFEGEKVYNQPIQSDEKRSVERVPSPDSGVVNSSANPNQELFDAATRLAQMSTIPLPVGTTKDGKKTVSVKAVTKADHVLVTVTKFTTATKKTEEEKYEIRANGVTKDGTLISKLEQVSVPISRGLTQAELIQKSAQQNLASAEERDDIRGGVNSSTKPGMTRKIILTKNSADELRKRVQEAGPTGVTPGIVSSTASRGIAIPTQKLSGGGGGVTTRLPAAFGALKDILDDPEVENGVDDNNAEVGISFEVSEEQVKQMRAMSEDEKFNFLLQRANSDPDFFKTAVKVRKKGTARKGLSSVSSTTRGGTLAPLANAPSIFLDSGEDYEEVRLVDRRQKVVPIPGVQTKGHNFAGKTPLGQYSPRMVQSSSDGNLHTPRLSARGLGAKKKEEKRDEYNSLNDDEGEDLEPLPDVLFRPVQVKGLKDALDYYLGEDGSVIISAEEGHPNFSGEMKISRDGDSYTLEPTGEMGVWFGNDAMRKMELTLQGGAMMFDSNGFFDVEIQRAGRFVVAAYEAEIERAKKSTQPPLTNVDAKDVEQKVLADTKAIVSNVQSTTFVPSRDLGPTLEDLKALGQEVDKIRSSISALFDEKYANGGNRNNFPNGGHIEVIRERGVIKEARFKGGKDAQEYWIGLNGESDRRLLLVRSGLSKNQWLGIGPRDDRGLEAAKQAVETLKTLREEQRRSAVIRKNARGLLATIAQKKQNNGSHGFSDESYISLIGSDSLTFAHDGWKYGIGTTDQDLLSATEIEGGRPSHDAADYERAEKALEALRQLWEQQTKLTPTQTVPAVQEMPVISDEQDDVKRIAKAVRELVKKIEGENGFTEGGIDGRVQNFQKSKEKELCGREVSIAEDGGAVTIKYDGLEYFIVTTQEKEQLSTVEIGKYAEQRNDYSRVKGVIRELERLWDVEKEGTWKVATPRVGKEEATIVHDDNGLSSTQSFKELKLPGFGGYSQVDDHSDSEEEDEEDEKTMGVSKSDGNLLRKIRKRGVEDDLYHTTATSSQFGSAKMSQPKGQPPKRVVEGLTSDEVEEIARQLVGKGLVDLGGFQDGVSHVKVESEDSGEVLKIRFSNGSLSPSGSGLRFTELYTIDHDGLSLTRGGLDSKKNLPENLKRTKHFLSLALEIAKAQGLQDVEEQAKVVQHIKRQPPTTPRVPRLNLQNVSNGGGTIGRANVEILTGSRYQSPRAISKNLEAEFAECKKRLGGFLVTEDGQRFVGTLKRTEGRREISLPKVRDLDVSALFDPEDQTENRVEFFRGSDLLEAKDVVDEDIQNINRLINVIIKHAQRIANEQREQEALAQQETVNNLEEALGNFAWCDAFGRSEDKRVVRVKEREYRLKDGSVIGFNQNGAWIARPTDQKFSKITPDSLAELVATYDLKKSQDEVQIWTQKRDEQIALIQKHFAAIREKKDYIKSPELRGKVASLHIAEKEDNTEDRWSSNLYSGNRITVYPNQDGRGFVLEAKNGEAYQDYVNAEKELGAIDKALTEIKKLEDQRREEATWTEAKKLQSSFEKFFYDTRNRDGDGRGILDLDHQSGIFKFAGGKYSFEERDNILVVVDLNAKLLGDRVKPRDQKKPNMLSFLGLSKTPQVDVVAPKPAMKDGEITEVLGRFNEAVKAKKDELINGSKDQFATLPINHSLPYRLSNESLTVLGIEVERNNGGASFLRHGEPLTEENISLREIDAIASAFNEIKTKEEREAESQSDAKAALLSLKQSIQNLINAKNNIAVFNPDQAQNILPGNEGSASIALEDGKFLSISLQDGKSLTEVFSERRSLASLIADENTPLRADKISEYQKAVSDKLAAAQRLIEGQKYLVDSGSLLETLQNLSQCGDVNGIGVDANDDGSYTIYQNGEKYGSKIWFSKNGNAYFGEEMSFRAKSSQSLSDLLGKLPENSEHLREQEVEAAQGFAAAFRGIMVEDEYGAGRSEKFSRGFVVSKEVLQRGEERVGHRFTMTAGREAVAFNIYSAAGVRPKKYVNGTQTRLRAGEIKEFYEQLLRDVEEEKKGLKEKIVQHFQVIQEAREHVDQSKFSQNFTAYTINYPNDSPRAKFIVTNDGEIVSHGQKITLLDVIGIEKQLREISEKAKAAKSLAEYQRQQEEIEQQKRRALEEEQNRILEQENAAKKVKEDERSAVITSFTQLAYDVFGAKQSTQGLSHTFGLSGTNTIVNQGGVITLTSNELTGDKGDKIYRLQNGKVFEVKGDGQEEILAGDVRVEGLKKKIESISRVLPSDKETEIAKFNLRSGELPNHGMLVPKLVLPYFEIKDAVFLLESRILKETLRALSGCEYVRKGGALSKVDGDDASYEISRIEGGSQSKQFVNFEDNGALSGEESALTTLQANLPNLEGARAINNQVLSNSATILRLLDQIAEEKAKVGERFDGAVGEFSVAIEGKVTLTRTGGEDPIRYTDYAVVAEALQGELTKAQQNTQDINREKEAQIKLIKQHLYDIEEYRLAGVELSRDVVKDGNTYTATRSSHDGRGGPVSKLVASFNMNSQELTLKLDGNPTIKLDSYEMMVGFLKMERDRMYGSLEEGKITELDAAISELISARSKLAKLSATSATELLAESENSYKLDVGDQRTLTITHNGERAVSVANGTATLARQNDVQNDVFSFGKEDLLNSVPHFTSEEMAAYQEVITAKKEELEAKERELRDALRRRNEEGLKQLSEALKRLEPLSNEIRESFNELFKITSENGVITNVVSNDERDKSLDEDRRLEAALVRAIDMIDKAEQLDAEGKLKEILTAVLEGKEKRGFLSRHKLTKTTEGKFVLSKGDSNEEKSFSFTKDGCLIDNQVAGLEAIRAEIEFFKNLRSNELRQMNEFASKLAGNGEVEFSDRKSFVHKVKVENGADSSYQITITAPLKNGGGDGRVSIHTLKKLELNPIKPLTEEGVALILRAAALALAKRQAEEKELREQQEKTIRETIETALVQIAQTAIDLNAESDEYQLGDKKVTFNKSSGLLTLQIGAKTFSVKLTTNGAVVPESLDVEGDDQIIDSDLTGTVDEFTADRTDKAKIFTANFDELAKEEYGRVTRLGSLMVSDDGRQKLDRIDESTPSAEIVRRQKTLSAIRENLIKEIVEEISLNAGILVEQQPNPAPTWNENIKVENSGLLGRVITYESQRYSIRGDGLRPIETVSPRPGYQSQMVSSNPTTDLDLLHKVRIASDAAIKSLGDKRQKLIEELIEELPEIARNATDGQPYEIKGRGISATIEATKLKVGNDEYCVDSNVSFFAPESLTKNGKPLSYKDALELKSKIGEIKAALEQQREKITAELRASCGGLVVLGEGKMERDVFSSAKFVVREGSSVVPIDIPKKIDFSQPAIQIVRQVGRDVPSFISCRKIEEVKGNVDLLIQRARIKKALEEMCDVGSEEWSVVKDGDQKFIASISEERSTYEFVSNGISIKVGDVDQPIDLPTLTKLADDFEGRIAARKAEIGSQALESIRASIKSIAQITIGEESASYQIDQTHENADNALETISYKIERIAEGEGRGNIVLTLHEQPITLLPSGEFEGGDISARKVGYVKSIFEGDRLDLFEGFENDLAEIVHNYGEYGITIAGNDAANGDDADITLTVGSSSIVIPSSVDTVSTLQIKSLRESFNDIKEAQIAPRIVAEIAKRAAAITDLANPQGFRFEEDEVLLESNEANADFRVSKGVNGEISIYEGDVEYSLQGGLLMTGGASVTDLEKLDDLAKLLSRARTSLQESQEIDLVRSIRRSADKMIGKVAHLKDKGVSVEVKDLSGGNVAINIVSTTANLAGAGLIVGSYLLADGAEKLTRIKQGGVLEEGVDIETLRGIDERVSEASLKLSTATTVLGKFFGNLGKTRKARAELNAVLDQVITPEELARVDGAKFTNAETSVTRSVDGELVKSMIGDFDVEGKHTAEELLAQKRGLETKVANERVVLISAIEAGFKEVLEGDEERDDLSNKSLYSLRVILRDLEARIEREARLAQQGEEDRIARALKEKISAIVEQIYGSEDEKITIAYAGKQYSVENGEVSSEDGSNVDLAILHGIETKMSKELEELRVKSAIDIQRVFRGRKVRTALDKERLLALFDEIIGPEDLKMKVAANAAATQATAAIMENFMSMIGELKSKQANQPTQLDYSFVTDPSKTLTRSGEKSVIKTNGELQEYVDVDELSQLVKNERESRNAAIKKAFDTLLSYGSPYYNKTFQLSRDANNPNKFTLNNRGKEAEYEFDDKGNVVITSANTVLNPTLYSLKGVIAALEKEIEVAAARAKDAEEERRMAANSAALAQLKAVADCEGQLTDLERSIRSIVDASNELKGFDNARAEEFVRKSPDEERYEVKFTVGSAERTFVKDDFGVKTNGQLIRQVFGNGGDFGPENIDAYNAAAVAKLAEIQKALEEEQIKKLLNEIADIAVGVVDIDALSTSYQIDLATTTSPKIDRNGFDDVTLRVDGAEISFVDGKLTIEPAKTVEEVVELKAQFEQDRVDKFTALDELFTSLNDSKYDSYITRNGREISLVGSSPEIKAQIPDAVDGTTSLQIRNQQEILTNISRGIAAKILGEIQVESGGIATQPSGKETNGKVKITARDAGGILILQGTAEYIFDNNKIYSVSTDVHPDTGDTTKSKNKEVTDLALLLQLKKDLAKAHQIAILKTSLDKIIGAEGVDENYEFAGHVITRGADWSFNLTEGSVDSVEDVAAMQGIFTEEAILTERRRKAAALMVKFIELLDANEGVPQYNFLVDPSSNTGFISFTKDADSDRFTLTDSEDREVVYDFATNDGLNIPLGSLYAINQLTTKLGAEVENKKLTNLVGVVSLMEEALANIAKMVVGNSGDYDFSAGDPLVVYKISKLETGEVTLQKGGADVASLDVNGELINPPVDLDTAARQLQNIRDISVLFEGNRTALLNSAVTDTGQLTQYAFGSHNESDIGAITYTFGEVKISAAKRLEAPGFVVENEASLAPYSSKELAALSKYLAPAKEAVTVARVAKSAELQVSFADLKGDAELCRHLANHTISTDGSFVLTPKADAIKLECEFTADQPARVKSGAAADFATSYHDIITAQEQLRLIIEAAKIAKTAAEEAGKKLLQDQALAAAKKEIKAAIDGIVALTVGEKVDSYQIYNLDGNGHEITKAADGAIILKIHNQPEIKIVGEEVTVGGNPLTVSSVADLVTQTMEQFSQDRDALLVKADEHVSALAERAFGTESSPQRLTHKINDVKIVKKGDKISCSLIPADKTKLTSKEIAALNQELVESGDVLTSQVVALSQELKIRFAELKKFDPAHIKDFTISREEDEFEIKKTDGGNHLSCVFGEDEPAKVILENAAESSSYLAISEAKKRVEAISRKAQIKSDFEAIEEAQKLAAARALFGIINEIRENAVWRSDELEVRDPGDKNNRRLATAVFSSDDAESFRSPKLGLTISLIGNKLSVKKGEGDDEMDLTQAYTREDILAMTKTIKDQYGWAKRIEAEQNSKGRGSQRFS